MTTTFDNSNGYKILALSADEIKVWPRAEVCDRCGQKIESIGFYVGAFNLMCCPKCYEAWHYAIPEKSEGQIDDERRNIKYAEDKITQGKMVYDILSWPRIMGMDLLFLILLAFATIFFFLFDKSEPIAYMTVVCAFKSLTMMCQSKFLKSNNLKSNVLPLFRFLKKACFLIIIASFLDPELLVIGSFHFIPTYHESIQIGAMALWIICIICDDAILFSLAKQISSNEVSTASTSSFPQTDSKII